MAKQSKGECHYCKKLVSKSAFTKHLTSCKERQKVIETADQKAGKKENLYHLVVQDRYSKIFFLHLEMRGSAKLSDLDDYLRSIWLECCSHLSAFYLNSNYFASSMNIFDRNEFDDDSLRMNLKVDNLFQEGLELKHLYDFGTTTETLIKVVAMRKGVPLTKHPIVLMARNIMPDMVCSVCDEPAHWFCELCSEEQQESVYLCDEHAKTDPHTEEMAPSELFNSPRTGVCGYSGPATPPY